MSFTSTELFDYQKLKLIYDNWENIEIPNNAKEEWEIGENVFVPKQLIGGYLDKTTVLDNGIGSVEVTYEFSNIHQLDHQGRRFAVKAQSLQSFSKYIRHTITHDIYNDIDIVNCHPVILKQYCDKNGIACDCLTYYIEHRDECLNELMLVHKFNRDEAKRMFLTVMNGGKRFSGSKLFTAFKNETSTILSEIAKLPDNIELCKTLRQIDRSNLNGRLVNHILCGIENSILTAMISFLKSQFINCDNIVLAFDGFMIPKSCLDLEESFFTEMSQYLYEGLGYHVSITNKPQDLILDLQYSTPLLVKPHLHIDFNFVRSLTESIASKNKKGETVYNDEIDEGKTIEYLNQFLIFVHIGKPFIIELTDQVNKGYIFHQKTCGLRDDTFEPIYDWYKIWLASPYRRVIHNITFEPYLVAPQVETSMLTGYSSSFNLFRGFKHTKNEPFNADFKIDMSLVDPWVDLIKHNWCNDDPIMFNYIMKWFAHKIQRPTQKLQSTIVITSVLEGIGKNTFFDFFNRFVIGSEFGMTVGSIDELLNKYNDVFETSLIVCCDELKGGTKHEHTDALKKITTQTTRNIEAKFMAIRSNCPDYNDYIFFTNNWGVIKPSMSDRRYFCLEGKCDRANKHDYWNDLYSKYFNNQTGLHFFYYLATLSLDGFNPRDIPMTPWKRELKELSIPPVVRSVINYIIRNKDVSPSINNEKSLIKLDDLYKEWEMLGCSYKLSMRVFSADIQKILEIKTERHTIQKKKYTTIDTSINDLIEKIKAILKDPEYPFINDDI